MIEAEKQPLETAQNNDNTSAVSQEIEKSAPSAEHTNAKINLEMPLSEENVTVAEATVPSVTIEDTAAVILDSVATIDDTELKNLKQEVENLKGELEASNNQSEAFKIQYMRIAADFDNFRKRTQKEKEDLEQQIKSDTLKKLLPVVDDFERARSLIKPQTEAEMTIHKSYQGVYKQMVDSLKRLGVSPMRPEGKEFDPNLHEAIMREASTEHPEGTVIEELMRGYFLGERILRHAMVKVATGPETTVPSEKTNSDVASEN